MEGAKDAAFSKKDPRPRCSKSINGEPELSALRCFVEDVREMERQRAESASLAAEALKALMPSAQLSKAASVDGRLLFVIDGAVPQEVHENLFDCLQTDAFRRTEFARPDTREYRHHVVEYNPEKLVRTQLFHVVERLLRLLFPDSEGLEVYRIYTNAVMFGDAAFVHRDSSDLDHVTVLVYPNPEWAPELGGETVFYSESGEIVEAVEPRPGRICLFHGNILHKGSPPSRLLWGCRYTTAFKFAPEAPVPTGQLESGRTATRGSTDGSGMTAE